MEADTRKIVLEQEQTVTGALTSPGSEHVDLRILSATEDFQSFAGDKSHQQHPMESGEKDEQELRSKHNDWASLFTSNHA